MSEQYEIVDDVLEVLHREGILEHLIIVGSWRLFLGIFTVGRACAAARQGKSVVQGGCTGIWRPGG